MRFTKVELLLILRAYRAHPTRWIDVLNDVKANNPVSFTGQEHFVSWKSVKPGKLMSAGVIGDEEIR